MQRILARQSGGQSVSKDFLFSKMARKISVLHPDGHQDVQVKKSVAAYLVRNLLAVWIVENVTIQRLSIRELPPEAMTASYPLQPSHYIPEVLPPAEVQNCTFKLNSKTKMDGISKCVLLGIARELCESRP